MRPLAGAGREETRAPFSIQPDFAVNLAARDCIGDDRSVSIPTKCLPSLDEQELNSVSGMRFSMCIWILGFGGLSRDLEPDREMEIVNG